MYILETIYDDYDITYQTSINENIIPILILLGILCALIIIYFISMMRVFKKANRSGISAIIPIYNCAVLMEIINESKWKVLLLIIPGINIVYFCIFMYRLAKYFRKSKTFCILSAIFPLIMIPILAFSNSEYIGINEEAMRGVSVAKDIPVETNKKPTLSNPDQPLKERTKVNMSIGGGVYQKEYRDSLLEAKNIKETKKPDVAGFRVDPTEFTESTQLQQPTQPQSGTDLFQNVTFVETNNEDEQQTARSQIESVNLQISPLAPASETIQTESNNLLSVPLIPTLNPLQSSLESNTGSVDALGPIPEVSLLTPTGDGNNQSIDVNSNQNQRTISPMDNVPLISNTQEKETPSSNVDLLGANNTSAISPVTIESNSDTSSGAPSLLGQNTLTQQEIPTNSSESNEEFVNCPHCGAKVRNGSTKCFMCGKEL